MKRMILTLPFVLLACAPEDDTLACGGADLPDLIGAPVSSFDFATLDRPVRILPPNSIVTQDYLPHRLNVHLDQQGQVLRLACG